MTSIAIVLPYNFVTTKIKLTWRDIAYAVDRQFFSPNSAIKHAMVQFSTIENPPQSLIDLALLNKDESVHPYLDQLAEAELKHPVKNINEKWIYLILAWIFENKSNYSDPLGIVEQIYADFDYPKQISNFIRYMPSDEPNLGSLELNENRLYKKWETYLKEQENRIF